MSGRRDLCGAVACSRSCTCATSEHSQRSNDRMAMPPPSSSAGLWMQPRSAAFPRPPTNCASMQVSIAGPCLGASAPVRSPLRLKRLNRGRALYAHLVALITSGRRCLPRATRAPTAAMWSAVGQPRQPSRPTTRILILNPPGVRLNAAPRRRGHKEDRGAAGFRAKPCSGSRTVYLSGRENTVA